MGRKRDGVFLVFEYCQHDLANLIDSMGSHRFTMSEVKSLVTQVRSRRRTSRVGGWRVHGLAWRSR